MLKQASYRKASKPSPRLSFRIGRCFGEAELPRRHEPAVAGQHAAVLVDQDRVGPAELDYGRRDLIDLRLAVRARVALVRAQVLDRPELDSFGQRRQRGAVRCFDQGLTSSVCYRSERCARDAQSVLFVGLEFAIYSGVILSLCVFLRHTMRPGLPIGAPDPSTPQRASPTRSFTIYPSCPQIVFTRFQGALYFGAIEFLRPGVCRHCEEGLVYLRGGAYLDCTSRTNAVSPDFSQAVARERRAALRAGGWPRRRKLGSTTRAG